MVGATHCFCVFIFVDSALPQRYQDRPLTAHHSPTLLQTFQTVSRRLKHVASSSLQTCSPSWTIYFCLISSLEARRSFNLCKHKQASAPAASGLTATARQHTLGADESVSPISSARLALERTRKGRGAWIDNHVALLGLAFASRPINHPQRSQAAVGNLQANARRAKMPGRVWQVPKFAYIDASHVLFGESRSSLELGSATDFPRSTWPTRSDEVLSCSIESLGIKELYKTIVHAIASEYIS